MADAPGAAFVFKSGIYPGPTNQEAFETDALAAARDGSVWLTASGNLYAYSRENGAFTSVATSTAVKSAQTGVVQSLAPVDYQHVYFLSTDSAGATVVSYYQQSGVTQLAALPDHDTPAAITAGPDGTLWAVGAHGIYSYGCEGWTPQTAPPGTLTMVSVGSATFALALVNENDGPAIHQWNGTEWSPFTTVSAADVTWLAACADGTCWSGTATGLDVLLGDGTTSASFPYPNPAFVLGLFTAASRYACFYAAAVPLGPSGPVFGISMAAFGVMDQPAASWPSMTTGQQAAYEAITNAFMISDPAGFRSVYANLNASISEYSIQLSEMTTPSGIDPNDFKTVQTQLETELRYVDSVRNLFTNLATLNTDLGLEQTNTYNQVVTMVELPDQPSQQPSTLVTLLLGTMLDKLLDAALSQVPTPAQAVISLGMSVFNHIADQQAQNNGGTDRNSALEVACSNLAGIINAITTDTLVTTSAWETSILGDWGQLQACGDAINTGVWYWPPNFDADAVQGAGAAMQLNFYQMLVPVKWQIMQLWTLFIPGVGSPSTPPNAPAYSLVWQTDADAEGDRMFWFWICTDQSASPDINTNGPFPNQALMVALITVNAGDENDVFTGANGWNLPVQQGSDYQQPPGTLPFQPWLNSTSPIS